MEHFDSVLKMQKTRLARRSIAYPLLSPQEALATMLVKGEISNFDQFALNEKSKNRLFAFSLNDYGPLLLPTFQFDTDKKSVLPIVPQLCLALSGLNDLTVYFWLTSFDNDLQSTPAECLKDKSTYELLLDVASLFKNESTFTHLYHGDRS